ncbi:helix-turn-helix domain-containing protein [Clostridium massiliamazoniense]|uniref:helix-turn-helix domain-containing protein n=1 Tax=Clostridium massiliamazoniense TaxID=1347366 RepID=UPI0006D76E76|nr:helix-turn-helix transcriptional regulator [Clostridium massiliamazoniense]
MTQAERLKELRQSRGLSLRDLEKKTGISKTSLSRLENGERSGTLEALSSLADFYGVSLDYITCRPINNMVDEMIKVLVEQKVIVPGEPINQETQEMLINIIETSLNKQRNQS